MHSDTQRGERIKEERARLGLSQQQAAEVAGVRREMWAKYEAGSEPGAKALAGMAAAGVDVIYVLTSTPALRSRIEPIDSALFFRIADKLDAMAASMRKRWPERAKAEQVVKIYNYLAHDADEAADEDKVERTLRLVINQ
ncbi:helix-turn-helix transcriptional regulator [Roseateles chitinivorans]|uniref:helix-turn-helix transcriptional regulator n=1 Tax=Roseateles chitinivorans TaxID=2917965 RepID=UPI003D67A0F1